MELLTPSVGLIFWTGIIFVTLLIVLRATAWKPVVKALKDREDSITDALKSAEYARSEMANLKTENEQILNEARAERTLIIKEANNVKETIITEAKDKAKVEAEKMIEGAKIEINNQKNAALIDVKNQVAHLSLEVAEKILREQLATQEAQEKHIESLLEEVK